MKRIFEHLGERYALRPPRMLRALKNSVFYVKYTQRSQNIEQSCPSDPIRMIAERSFALRRAYPVVREDNICQKQRDFPDLADSFW